jgi:hypothetical protein
MGQDRRLQKAKSCKLNDVEWKRAESRHDGDPENKALVAKLSAMLDKGSGWEAIQHLK